MAKKPPVKAKVEEPKIGVTRLDMRYLPVDVLVPNAWNPNTEDQNTFELLKDEIAEVGMVDPVSVVPLDNGTYVILGGEHRWKACKELGFDELPCAILFDKKWTDVDLQKFVTVRWNALHGDLDPDKFLVLYKELSEKYGAESMQRLMGYADSKSFQKLLGWVKKGLKKSLPKAMAPNVEESMKEVKSVAELSSVIQEMFNQYGETVQQSFMIFTYGKQKHIYLSMDARMRRAMDMAMECCKKTNQDLNEFMAPLVEDLVRRASSDVEEKTQTDATKSDPSKDIDW